VPLTEAHIEDNTSAVYILAGWIVLGSTMLLFSIVIALFPRRLPRPADIGKGSPPTLDRCDGTMHRPNEEEPLTKAMLSDFMPVDPVPHAPDASVVVEEGTVLTDSGI
jgi:hypothetical protein